MRGNLAKRTNTTRKRGKSNLSFSDTGRPLTQRQLTQFELLCIDDKLPDDYRRFLLKHNGGSPIPDQFQWRRSRENRSASLDRLLGVDPGRLDEPRGLDVVNAILRWRDELPRFSIPIGVVDRDDILLLFTFGPRRGQIWIKDWEQVSPTVDKPTDAESAVYFVAGSFTDFLGMLHKPPDEADGDDGPVLFALDSTKVRGGQLKKILKKLGCHVFRYPGVTPRSGLPPAWQWSKYQMDRTNPAMLALLTNKSRYSDTNTDARPAGHKLLRVFVTKRHRAQLIEDLSTALGPCVALL
jgi:hypothetical protein